MLDKLKNFFKEVKTEAKKVNYPSRDDLIGSTRVVIITVVIVSVFLGVVDLSLSKIVKLLIR
jgi:preprotein translocase subunit SecE